MTQSDHSSKPPPSNDSAAQGNDLDALLSAYLEGDLDDDQWQYLEQKKGDSVFQSHWQDGLLTHTALMVGMEPGAAKDDQIVDFRKPFWRTIMCKVAVSAAAIILGIFVFQAVQKSVSPTNTPIVIVPQGLFHAIVIGSESDDKKQLTEGTFLATENIQQDSGWASIQTLHGVTITLQAPFEANIIGVDEIELISGAARVYVPGGAEGFKLTTPTMEVLDLGTEFAVKINADGTERCRVFEGAADVSFLDIKGKALNKQRLEASNSVHSNTPGQNLISIKEDDKDYHEIIIPPRSNLALQQSYPVIVANLKPLGYWRFESLNNGFIPNEVDQGIPLHAMGTADITEESGGNHSGELNNFHETELFALNELDHTKLQNNFTFSLYFQMDWLQNYSLISASRYDNKAQGHSFLMQAYANFGKSGLYGTGPHAVFRDPPAWTGGEELFGNTLLRPLHWHHMAATREGSTLTIYLDGKKVGSREISIEPMNYRPIFIGRMTSNPELDRVQAR
ncbi:MAG: hypothetical protein ACI9E1_001492, partial [Cryomorphaceae bacterium]